MRASHHVWNRLFLVCSHDQPHAKLQPFLNWEWAAARSSHNWICPPPPPSQRSNFILSSSKGSQVGFKHKTARTKQDAGRYCGFGGITGQHHAMFGSIVEGFVDIGQRRWRLPGIYRLTEETSKYGGQRITASPHRPSSSGVRPTTRPAGCRSVPQFNYVPFCGHGTRCRENYDSRSHSVGRITPSRGLHLIRRRRAWGKAGRCRPVRFHRARSPWLCWLKARSEGSHEAGVMRIPRHGTGHRAACLAAHSLAAGPSITSAAGRGRCSVRCHSDREAPSWADRCSDKRASSIDYNMRNLQLV